MLTQNDFIHGNKFSELCEFGIFDGMEPQPIPKTGDIKIVYCKQDRVDRFFKHIDEYGKKIILVTHNADTNIDTKFINALPKNVVHWFAQNVLIDNNRITALPIGLERPGVGRSSDYAAILRYREKRRKEEPKHRFLLSINTNTNPSLRQPVVEALKLFNEVTIVNNLNFDEYLNMVADHDMIISPPGNGYDCHRTWEALYVGATPIVWRVDKTRDDQLFYRMPVIKIDGLADLIACIKQKKVISFQPMASPQLYFNYWKNMIIGARGLC